MDTYVMNMLVDINEQRNDGTNTDFTIINKDTEYKVVVYNNAW